MLLLVQRSHISDQSKWLWWSTISLHFMWLRCQYKQISFYYFFFLSSFRIVISIGTRNLLTLNNMIEIQRKQLFYNIKSKRNNCIWIFIEICLAPVCGTQIVAFDQRKYCELIDCGFAGKMILKCLRIENAMLTQSKSSNSWWIEHRVQFGNDSRMSQYSLFVPISIYAKIHRIDFVESDSMRSKWVELTSSWVSFRSSSSSESSSPELSAAVLLFDFSLGMILVWNYLSGKTNEWIWLLRQMQWIFTSFFDRLSES